jgi:glycosyltransferase involved in cell wall biosynthesis
MSRKSKTVDMGPLTLIVEPNPHGHRLYYVGLLIDSCRTRGRRALVLTTATAVESTEWSVHLAAKAPEVVIHPPHAFAFSDIAQAATDAGADLTTIPDGDRYLASVLRKGWPGPGELALLVIRADGQPRNSPWLKQVRGVAKKTLAWSAGLRPRVRVSALRSPLARRRGPLRWTADPITLHCTEEHKHRTRERLDGYGDRYWLGVFGVITPRKNVPLIIQSILDQPDIGLVIAGSIDAQVSEAIAPLLAKLTAVGGQVLHLPGTLTDAEFDGAIGAVDCVVVAHSNEGPSGVVFKAAASGRRLILAGAESLKRDAAYLGEQAMWSRLDAEALNQAVRRARRLPRPGTTVILGADEFLAALA